MTKKGHMTTLILVILGITVFALAANPLGIVDRDVSAPGFQAFNDFLNAVWRAILGFFGVG